MAKETVINEGLLVEEARRGDLRSFSVLVDLYSERLIRAAYVFVGNFEDAKDLAQEAFVKAYENLGKFESRSRFYTWLYRILANHCKDFLRKKKLRYFLPFFSEDGERDELQSIEALAVDRKDGSGSLLNKELEAAIRAAMDRLPFQQRTAFALRFLEDLSLEEIAEVMELSTGAVKAHLWQAGQKMQKFLKHYAFPEEKEVGRG